jgi:molybdopterin molybdotransferase/putative molybdopterin biosynthesis protein
MPIEAIIDRIRECWRPAPGKESVPVIDALGLVPFEDVFSAIDIPVHRGAMCDGIAVNSGAFRGSELNESVLPDTSRWVANIDYAFANMGDDFDDRFDAVIAIEDVTVVDGKVVLPKNVKAASGALIEPKGGTVYKGELLAEKGRRISSLDIANLAAACINSVETIKRPLVAFIPTGDRLVPTGARPSRGQIVDSNSPMVKAVLSEFEADVKLFPIVRDAPRELPGVLEHATRVCDIVLIGGGSSKGTDDFCPGLIKQGADFFNHYAAIRPGRPIATAVRDNKPVVNLPGPAFSTFFPLQWCVRELIDHWYGVAREHRPVIRAEAGDNFEMEPTPIAYGLFFEVRTVGDKCIANRLDESIRGDLFMKTDAYAILPIGSEGFKAGDILELQPVGRSSRA